MLVFAIAALFSFWLAAQIPYTGDDWDWGLDIGLQHLLTADINSRYAGNFLVVVMTRSHLLKTLILGSCFFLIPFLMTVIVMPGKLGENWAGSTAVFLCCSCLILSMDKTIWQQTYGWISGFANYGVSAVLVLVFLQQAGPLFREEWEDEAASWGKTALLFLLGMVMQLFLENLAIVMVLLSASMCLLCRLRSGAWNKKYIAILLGNLAGLAIMFSSAIYPALFDTGKTLGNGRELSYSTGGGILAMAVDCFSVFMKEMATLIWENNVVLCCTISVLLVLLWFREGLEQYPRLGWAVVVIDLLSIPYFVIFSHLEYGKYLLLRFGLLDLFELTVNVGFFAIVALQVVLLFGKRRMQMWKLLFLWVSGPLTVLPLTAVVIEGGRFYLTSNVFLILFAAFLMLECLKDLPRKGMQPVLALLLSASVTFGMYYGFLYREISICTKQRREITAQALEAGEKKIILPAYSYTVMDYVWMGEPKEDYRKVWYKEFHGIPQDVEVEFVYE